MISRSLDCLKIYIIQIDRKEEKRVGLIEFKLLLDLLRSGSRWNSGHRKSCGKQSLSCRRGKFRMNALFIYLV